MSLLSTWGKILNNMKLRFGASATYGGGKHNKLMSQRTLYHNTPKQGGNKFEIGRTADEESDKVKHVSVPSTAVESVTYEPKKENLKVNFVNGKHAYDYPATKEEFKDFLESDSKGRAVRKLRTYY